MIETAKDVYTWRVIYEDEHTCINEHEVNNFAEVDEGRASAVMLIPVNEDSPPHIVMMPEWGTPVFFRRRSIEISSGDGQEGNRTTIHCIGWKRGSEAAYLFVMSDGTTLLTDDLQAV